MLVDTSVWIDFFCGRQTTQVGILEESITQHKNIYYCGLVLTELLQGISNKKDSRLIKSHFTSLLYLEMEKEIYLNAADIYAMLRKKGVTIRKTIDCLIAALAISSKLPLLHNDKDFKPIAKHCGLIVF